LLQGDTCAIATRSAGRATRSRLADLLIAATAAANGLALYTRKPKDFTSLKPLVPIKTI